jgi:hypothetical protein
MKNYNPATIFRCVIAFVGMLVFLSSVNFVWADFSGRVEDNSITQGQNSPPIANSISKRVLKNNSLTLLLSSLVLDQDGDELAYMEILQFPKHGSIELVSPVGLTMYTFSNNNNQPAKKFDGGVLRVRYSPDENYIGEDAFAYRATDSQGAQSDTRTVALFVDKEPSSEQEKLPVAKDFMVSTQVKSALHIDFRSLTLDLDGDPLELSFEEPIKRKPGNTFSQSLHGINEYARYYLNYLPSSVGKETVIYTASDSQGHTATGKVTITITEEKRGGNFGLLLSSLSTSKAKNGSNLENIKTFFSGLPLKRIFESGSRGLLFLFFGSVFTIFLFYLIELFFLKNIYPEDQGVIRLVYLGMVITGILMCKSGAAGLSILMIALGICFAVWGILALLPLGFSKLRTCLLRLPINYPLTILILLLNYLILYYHFAAISIPAGALDSDNYIATYNFYKHGILGYSAVAHSSRLFTPFLASLVPVDDALTSFKVVNVIFMNLGVITLFQLWKELQIKPFLIWTALLWLFLHQYGMIRYFNFWPTTVYAPALVFCTLLVYIIFKNRYKWLLLVCPLGTLTQDSILIFTIALLGYKLVAYYLSGERPEDDKKAIKWILASILITILATKFFKSFLYVPEPGFLVHSAQAFISQYFGSDPTVWVFVVICSYFNAYGAFLVLLTQNMHSSYRNNSLYNLLILFSIINVAFCIVTVTNLKIFMGYPFIMTLALLSINSLPSSLVGVGFFLSLPLTRVAVDFPFGKDPTPVFQSFSPGAMSMYAICLILLYHFLSFLKKVKLEDKIQYILKFLQNSSNPSSRA